MFSRKPIILAFSILVSCVLVASQPARAEWMLNDEASDLYYITSKAAAVSEMNSFGELSGNIDDNGNAMVAISLGSVDTAIDIRNERMREIVFQVATYPVASVSLTVDDSRLSGLAPGESFRAGYDAGVSLHGMEQTVSLEVVVTGLQDGGLLVTLARPLIINAATFGLAEGVEQLREIAGLPSINNNVVVDFTLQLDAAD